MKNLHPAALALLLLPGLLLPVGCGPAGSDDTGEQAVQLLPLQGELAIAEAEVSGMTWVGDALLIVPQNSDLADVLRDLAPGETRSVERTLYILDKADILNQIDGLVDSEAGLSPREIPFELRDMDVPGFRGFESIAVRGDQVFLTFEADKADGSHTSYLVRGHIEGELDRVVVDFRDKTEVGSQSDLAQMGEEALVVTDEHVFTLHEANGSELNPNPEVKVYDHDLVEQSALPFPTLEYRVTDATAMDDDGRFWAINQYTPAWERDADGERIDPAREGDELSPESDPLIEMYGEGATHSESATVERLVEFRYSPTGVWKTDAAPIQFELDEARGPRNWEALARLDDRGFLVMTAGQPETMLGFVEAPCCSDEIVDGSEGIDTGSRSE